MPAVIPTIRWSASRQLDQLGREHGGVVRVLRRRRHDRRRGRRVVGHRFGRHRVAGRRAVAGAVAGVGRRGHRRRIAIGGSAAPWNPTWSASAGRKPRPFCVRTWTMTGPGSVERLLEGLEQGMEVVARDEPDVGDPEVLEQLARLGEVDDRPREPLAQLEDGRADDRDPLDGPVVGALALAATCPTA